MAYRLGFRRFKVKVLSLSFRVKGSGFRLYDSGLGFRVSDIDFQFPISSHKPVHQIYSTLASVILTLDLLMVNSCTWQSRVVPSESASAQFAHLRFSRMPSPHTRAMLWDSG